MAGVNRSIARFLAGLGASRSPSSGGAGRLRGDLGALRGAKAAVPLNTGSFVGEAWPAAVGGLGVAVVGCLIGDPRVFVFGGTVNVKGMGAAVDCGTLFGDLGACDAGGGADWTGAACALAVKENMFSGKGG